QTSPVTLPCPLHSPPAGHHLGLHSFPTRRSSDLRCITGPRRFRSPPSRLPWNQKLAPTKIKSAWPFTKYWKKIRRSVFRAIRKRSEEHTSELQSLAYLVCRLLLEKKKTISQRSGN